MTIRFELLLLYMSFRISSSCLQLGHSTSRAYDAYTFHEPHIYFDCVPDPGWGFHEIFPYCLDELDIFVFYDNRFNNVDDLTYDEYRRNSIYRGECRNHSWFDWEYGEELDVQFREACARLPRVCECLSLRVDSGYIKVYGNDNPFYHSNVSQYNVTVPITSYDEDRCTVSAYCQDGTSLVVFDGKDHYEAGRWVSTRKEEKVLQFGSSELSGMCDAGAKQWIVDDGIHDIVTINLLHMTCVNYTKTV